MKNDVFIGMPVYNGERFLVGAIESLRAQTYTDWRLVISDNASTDRTEEICREFAAADPRITYTRQSTNIGALANFEHMLAEADGELFMWAAADDEWAPQFLEACTTQLVQHPDAGFAFTDMVDIDSRGVPIRVYPSYSRYATKWRALNVCRFITAYEIMGKANPIYSLFRLDFLRTTWPLLQNIWHHKLAIEGSADVAAVLGLLARRPMAITPQVLFRKRLLNEKDGQEQFHDYRGRLKLCLPTPLHVIYCRYMVMACKGTPWWLPTLLLTAWRHFCLKVYRTLYKNKKRRRPPPSGICDQCGGPTQRRDVCWECTSHSKSSATEI